MFEPHALAEDFAASPQIKPEEVAAVAAAGFRTILNDRPDGEVPGQPTGAAIEAAARAAGLHYLAIPIGGMGIAEDAIFQLAEALQNHAPVLGYCRSGARSALLWSLLMVSKGRAVDDVLEEARTAGFDLGGMRPLLDRQAKNSR